MTEQTVTLETAKLLKQIGFDWKVHMFYLSNGTKLYNTADTYHTDVSLDSTDFLIDRNKKGWMVDKYGNECFGCQDEKYFESFSAPTQSLAQKFLRDKYDAHIYVEVFLEDDVNCYASTVSADFGEDWEEVVYFNTYEKALENALQESIELIINNEKGNL